MNNNQRTLDLKDACLQGLERFQDYATHTPYLKDPQQKLNRKLVDSLGRPSAARVSRTA